MFDPAATTFTTGNAVFLANASDVAYLDDSAAAARAMLGLRAARAFDHAASDTQGFAGVADRFALLAFRGSEQIRLGKFQDWLTDVNAGQSARPPYAGEVHVGFAAALTAAWDDAARALAGALDDAAVPAGPALPLFVTGHSLGGALATLAAFRLTCQPGDLDARVALASTYTFGAPRVGNAAFCGAYASTVWRVVDDLDVVPELPLEGTQAERLRAELPRWAPAWLRDLAERSRGLPDYGHVGRLVYVDRDANVGEVARRPDWFDAYVRQSIRSFGRSVTAPVTDHFIDQYISRLDEARRRGPGNA